MDRLAYLSHLDLTNFRSLVDLDLKLPPGVVVFFGPNAQGKTSLLEAVYLLAIARSFRAENEREVVNFQAAAEGGQGLVGGVIEQHGERLQIYVGYQCLPGSGPADVPAYGAGRRGLSVRKQIRVSRVRRTASELVGLVTAVLFSADDIRLVQGPPADRRRFLDILISQADPLYLKGLQRYQRVVQQRNQLLRMLRDGRAHTDELAFWDDELVREGAWITYRRQEVMAALAPSCAEHHRQLSGPEEDLQVEYRPSVPIGDGLPATEDRFRESLAAAASRERATASTAVGPHRDDFDLRINEVDMGTFASRGQARTLALTLRLAEAAYLASVRGGGPIILLDDVLSELDAQRGKRVLEKATQYEQTLITTTEPEHIRGFFGPAATYFSVVGGGVHPCP
ncbi:MAG: DNA replication/repair protein RecF [Dehalococcoidia bacterium]|nr:DNA replication/repair protein RecF [Dehalococcoidia bacterium]